MNKFILVLALLILVTSAAGLEQHEGFPVNVGSALKARLIAQDIDGDGKLEIIAAPENRMVKVFDNKGAIKWENAGGRVQDDTGRVPLVSNLLGDVRLEIISYGNPGYSDPAFYIWDASGSNLKSMTVGKYLLVSPPSIAREGVILIGAAPGVSFSGITQAAGVHAFDSMGNKLWYLELGRSVNFMASIPVGDIDGDGIDEAVILTQDINSANPQDGKVWVIKVTGEQGTIMWSSDLGGDARGAGIGDINGDGMFEIVVASTSGVHVFDKNGNELYNHAINSNKASPVIADIDGDGVNEVLVASGADNKIYIISSGAIREFFAEKVSSNLALGDLNNDGKLEIAAGNSDGSVYVWDYDGKVLEARNAERKYQYFTSALIADLEGDGSKEIILGNKNGNIHVFDTKAPVPPIALISSPLNGSVHQLNSQVEFISSSTDDGTIVSYKWESSIDGVIGNAASFSRALSAGWHNITLTVTDNDGLSSSTGVMVKVNKPPAAYIESPLDGAAYKQKDAVIFSGRGEDGDGSIASYQWYSDIDGILANTGSFTSPALSTGLHNITFTVTDNDGASGIKTVRINQRGYDVAWNLKQKPVMGETSLLSAAGGSSIYKLGSMVPIKFTAAEEGSVIDTSVRVMVFDPTGKEVFSAAYGNGSKAVRIDEEGSYIANFKSDKNGLPGAYTVEVRFDSQRRNQEFSKGIYLLNQRNTNFVQRAVNMEAKMQGNAFAYEWKLDDTVLGIGESFSWTPSVPGIYNIQLVITNKNNNKIIDMENYSVIVNAEADANGDDVVNVLDLSLLGLNWGKTVQNDGFDDGADVNGDGKIDIMDAVRIGKRWSY